MWALIHTSGQFDEPSVNFSQDHCNLFCLPTLIALTFSAKKNGKTREPLYLYRNATLTHHCFDSILI